jgi:asparagine synthase (glutamine-hydrolysing)
MAGLFGWHGNAPSADPDEARRVLAAMCQDESCVAETRRDAALAVTTPLGGGSVLQNEDLLVAIAGMPVWNDSALSETAKRDGHAAALAQAYKTHGIDVCKRVGGAFTLTIIDHRSGRVVAAVDRMGIGRLYYGCPQDGGIVFGTTADGVREYPKLSATMSAQGLYDYLFFFMSPAPGTIYTEQKKLLGAQYLVFEKGTVRTDFYWRMPYREHTNQSAREVEAQLRELLGDAVESAMKQAGGGQIGAFLSGGLDSSTMAGLVERTAPGKATCFTIGFDADGFDEMPYAKLAAEHFNCRHQPHYLTNDDLMDAIGRIVKAYDEPYGNSSAVPTYVCARVAREHGVDTMIAGDGGDELFAGNERYVANRIFDYYTRLPKIVRHGLIEPTVSLLSHSFETDFFRRARNFVQFANIAKAERPFARNLYGETAANGVFDP